jgi:TPR repeat protein
MIALFLVLVISLLYQASTNGILFESDHRNVRDFILEFNLSSLLNTCEENLSLEKCYEDSNSWIYKKKFWDSDNHFLFSNETILYNKYLSEIYYQSGAIEYFGFIKKKPNLVEGFGKFLISAFHGNPKALYKLFIILETNMIKLLIEGKDIERLKSSNEMIRYIINSKFWENFNFPDDYSRNNIALQFLFSSALYKYEPASNAIAYKHYKGYGVPHSCETSLKYYKECSQQNIKLIHKRNKPNYYEKVNIAKYEYIGHKFSNEMVDIDGVSDFLKIEAQNGGLSSIQQLGQMYLYGLGITQDFHQAVYYFEMGSKLNDSISIFNLGEMYLNGWGVGKNYTEAFRLFSHAMTMGYSKAWNSLGYMYYYGLGVEKNVKRAYDYFKSILFINY